MKRIVLKPALKLGETLKFKDDVGTLQLNPAGRFYLQLEDGDQIMLGNPHEFDIIESPEEQAKVADAGKVMAEPSICYCKKFPHTHAHNAYMCEKHIEKPPIKLRVGGVYRYHNGALEEIIRENDHLPHDHHARYVGKSGRTWRYDGIYRYSCDKDIEYDLIEEVQPEQEEHKHEMLYFCSLSGRLAKLCTCGCMGGIYYTCKNCDFDSRNKKENAKEKEAVEYCKGCVYYNVYIDEKGNKICTSCDKQMPEGNPSKEKCTCQWGGCPKDHGNPFRVGEKIYAYYVSASDYACYVATKVTTISGDLVYTERGSFHYKQCERVES